MPGQSQPRQVRLAADIGEAVLACVDAGEGRSMAEVVDQILRAEFIRREQAGPGVPEGTVDEEPPREPVAAMASGARVYRPRRTTLEG